MDGSSTEHDTIHKSLTALEFAASCRCLITAMLTHGFRDGSRFLTLPFLNRELYDLDSVNFA